MVYAEREYKTTVFTSARALHAAALSLLLYIIAIETIGRETLLRIGVRAERV